MDNLSSSCNSPDNTRRPDELDARSPRPWRNIQMPRTPGATSSHQNFFRANDTSNGVASLFQPQSRMNHMEALSAALALVADDDDCFLVKTSASTMGRCRK